MWLPVRGPARPKPDVRPTVAVWGGRRGRAARFWRSWLAGGLGLGFFAPVQAQDTPSLRSPTGGAVQADAAAFQGKVPAPGTAEEKKPGAKDEDQRRGSFVVAPIPIVNPAIGSGIVPVVAYIFRLRKQDTISAPSTVGAAALFTNNGTRVYGAGADLYFLQNHYDLKVGYGRGNVNYDLYGIGYPAGANGVKLPLRQDLQLFVTEFLRNVGWHTFVGGRFSTGSSLISLRSDKPEIEPPPDVNIGTTLRALGLTVVRDTRPNRFYPVEGSLIEFSANFFAKSLGSHYSFQSYDFTFNKYVSFDDRQVLAYSLFLCDTGGAAPFFAECLYGTNNQLRGYKAGQYLDRSMVTAQAEYRLVLPWRFGATVFAGIGGVANGLGQLKADQLLPAGGTGARFLLSKSYHVNLRSDFAWGRNSFTWSMGVGEAF